MNKEADIYNEKNSTSLVWIIWLLIFSICLLWWADSNDLSLKSSIKESYKESVSKKAYLSVWNQTIIIWWQEYEVIINPKN